MHRQRLKERRMSRKWLYFFQLLTQRSICSACNFIGSSLNQFKVHNCCNILHAPLFIVEYSTYVPHSEKLSREKTFMNFAVLEPPAKIFSAKFGYAIPTYDRF